MRKTKKLNIVLLATLLVTLLTITLKTTTCYADSKNKTSIVYNTKDLGINTMNKDGSIYIPIRAFSENLHYKVLWDSATQTVRIYNNLSDIYLNMNGDVKVNNVESKSEKVPVLVNGSVYVPLRFVSENLGINVNYDAKNSKVTMTGRDIYEISQKDPTKPYLIAYTKDGRKQVGLVSEKDSYVTETSIVNVERTKYSDIISTDYTSSGIGIRSHNNCIYVKDGKMINNSNRLTNAFVTDSGKKIDTIRYDDRVAFLNFDDKNNSYVRVYNDVTGKLIAEINTKELYNKNNTYDGYDYRKEDYGNAYNIQAVGKDFVVVSMFRPYEDAKDEFMAYDTLYCHTTVINLESLEMYPVYNNLNYFKEYNELGQKSGIRLFGGVYDIESSRDVTMANKIAVPDDCVYFDGIQNDGSLRFVGHYTKNDVNEHEWCTVNYKK